MNDSKLIRELLNLKEGVHLEFLASLEKDAVARHLCGFLNGDGGQVVVGVNNKSEPLGLKDAEKQMNYMQDYLLKEIVPEAPVSITIETVDHAELLNFKVWGGSKQPYIYDGNIFYRVGKKTVKATSEQISSLIHDRKLSEEHWERKVALGVDLEDLDSTLILQTIKEARSNHRTSFEGNKILDFLNHYGLIKGGAITNACVVLFAKQPAKFLPQIRVQLTEYSEGKTDSSYQRNTSFDGNIFEIHKALETYINGLGVRSVFDKNRWKRLDFRFPNKALQEGIVNALIHRDYSKRSGGVSIAIHSDKVIISNSGKLPEELDIKDLKKNHRSHPVNPDIAHIVYMHGLIDKLGKGTIKVLEACKEEGLKIPQWKETKEGISLTFNGPKNLASRKGYGDAVSEAVNRSGYMLGFKDESLAVHESTDVYRSTYASEASKQFISEAVNEVVNEAVNKAVFNRLVNEIILLYDTGLSLKDLMLTFDVSRATMQRDLALLKQNKFVEFEGAAKTGVYRLTDTFRDKLNDASKR